MKSNQSKTRKERTDIHQLVTDNVIAALEKGTPPWRKPWKASSGGHTVLLGMPVNAFSGHKYRGVNIVHLWAIQAKFEYPSSRWISLKQANLLGGSVIAGETSTPVVWWKSIDVQDEDEDGNLLFDLDGNKVMKTIFIPKWFNVYNVAQCQNLPDEIVGAPAIIPVPEEDPVDDSLDADLQHQIQTIMNNMAVKFFTKNQDQAYYRPSTDSIFLPLRRQFNTEGDYWCTLLHEVIHSTGHKKRLNREGIVSENPKFGNPTYAFEELIAELGGAFLCAELGILGELQHESYISNWLTKLKSDKKYIFSAAKQASEAVDHFFLHDETAVEMPEEESAAA